MSCDSIGPSAAVDDADCSMLAVASGRVDIAPGMADVDYVGEWRLFGADEGNGFEAIPLSIGHPILK